MRLLPNVVRALGLSLLVLAPVAGCGGSEPEWVVQLRTDYTPDNPFYPGVLGFESFDKWKEFASAPSLPDPSFDANGALEALEGVYMLQDGQEGEVEEMLVIPGVDVSFIAVQLRSGDNTNQVLWVPDVNIADVSGSRAEFVEAYPERVRIAQRAN